MKYQIFSILGKNGPIAFQKYMIRKTVVLAMLYQEQLFFSTRFCIKNNLSQIINFSPQNLFNCLNGYSGEFPDVVWEYIKTNGITTEKCQS